jgi:hypothetical protein
MHEVLKLIKAENTMAAARGWWGKVNREMLLKSV